MGSTATVIDCFKNVANKKQWTFIHFDVENVCPSISLNLFNEAIQYASTITEISGSDRAIIKYSRKTLFVHNNQPWKKKSGHPDFDVPIGCYDVEEICEQVGIFIFTN